MKTKIKSCFSLADLAGRIQPSSFTPSYNEEKQSESSSRNKDLTSQSNPLTKTFINTKEHQQTQRNCELLLLRQM